MPHPSEPDDLAFMRRALALARRGEGRVEPNPMVGCVIVRAGRVLGEGWHRRFGGPHAEVEALRACCESPRGATLYVTLEPCRHFGKTPPCTRALIEAGIGRVVIAHADPSGESGGGSRELRGAGMQVEFGLLEDAARELLAPFVSRVVRGRPWIILKWAQSFDGRVATRTGDSKWISDEVCRAHAHRLRGRVDAIVVGVGTVLTDDPLLTCRVGRPKRIAARIVLDSRLRTPKRAQLVRTAGEAPTWIVCGREASPVRMRALRAAGCNVLPLATDRAGRPRLDALLRHCCDSQMTNVLVEGGPAVLGAFVERALADEIQVYVAPLLIGGAEAPGAIGGRGAARVRDARAIPQGARLRPLGHGWFLRQRLA